MTRETSLAATSIGVALLVLGRKAAAWWLTGSVALMADALESVVNVVATSAALAAVIYSQRPADANHPYGHAKAEYFSAVLEGVLIVVAAGLILRESWLALLSPRAPDEPVLGLAANGVATVINGVWAAVLFRRGRRLRSPALVADAHLILADVVTSLGVLVGVGLVAVTGMLWLDPAVASLTALNILWSGWRLVRESVGGLMDEAVRPELLARIRGIVATHAAGAIEAHDIRTRHAGRFTFIEFHLVVPEEMRVGTAHEICDRVEEALKAEIADSVITIHVEPPHKAKHHGVVVV
ncbi:cation diffusion facilitator family transporter [Elioraea tepida]|uniref:Cation diffusion facilitator family transporter n=1 Tax=Elioraea tepida TaxID=2843330 RepID=A0A975YK67_9PROT|nr:cation diffusion facilitator family transporter [Elioraea tepida]QXM25465.1 cation diffusion facilitator family transporter [Elioraea tepida]